jgi:hypothetical protein
MGGRQGRRSGGVWEVYGRRNGGALGWRVGGRLAGAMAGYWQMGCSAVACLVKRGVQRAV